MRYALPALRSPARRDEGWVHHACYFLQNGVRTRNTDTCFLRNVYRTAFEKEKELTDRALKLAEAGKSKSNWELQGILRVAAFVPGLLVGK
jgi:hypothetical protein